MNLFMKLNNKKLSLMLLLSLSSQAYCHSEPTTHTEDTQTTSKNQLNVNVSEQEDAQYAELHNNLITQINMIESALDTIGQVRANIRGFQEKNSNELSEDEITQESVLPLLYLPSSHHSRQIDHQSQYHLSDETLFFEISRTLRILRGSIYLTS